MKRTVATKEGKHQEEEVSAEESPENHQPEEIAEIDLIPKLRIRSI
ncbi:hypothetical protein [Anaerotignum sp.]|nr:hypothetical protein [Anaerotignum sp.]